MNFRKALPYAVCAAGLAAFFYPEFASLFRRMQWDIGDTRLVNLVLEQSYRWVQGRASLWDPPYFYPVRNAAGYTDLFLGEAPLYWLARACGLGLDSAMQAFMLAIAALNFGVAYLWLRRPLRFGPVGASAGAFLFAYGFPRGVQLGHPALQPAFPSLLALYGLWRLFGPPAPGEGREPRPGRPERALALVVGGVALQLLTGFYLGWFLGLALGIAAAFALADPARRRAAFLALRGHWLVATVAASAGAVAIAPMAAHYLEAAREVGLRPFSAVFPPRIQAWFYLGPESWLYPWQNRLKGFRMLDYGPEQKIGIGLVTTVFVLLGWRRIWKTSSRGSALRLLGGVSLALFLLCTEFWPGLKAWVAVYRLVPGAKAIRALSRIGIVLLVPGAVGLAAFIDGLAERGRGAGRRWAALALAFALVFLEQGHRGESFDKLEVREQVAALREAIDPATCRFFYFSPWTDGATPDYRYQVDAMWAALETGVPTLNGYSGNAPPTWKLADDRLLGPADEKRLGGALADWMHEQALDPAGLCWLEPERVPRPFARGD